MFGLDKVKLDSDARPLVQQVSVDAAQDWSIANLTRHIRALWRHVARLEAASGTSSHEVVLRAGDASITLKRDGSVIIKGKDITIEGTGKINIKASGDLVMKGSKIAQN